MIASRFSTIQACYQRTDQPSADGWTNRTTTEIDRYQQADYAMCRLIAPAFCALVFENEMEYHLSICAH